MISKIIQTVLSKGIVSIINFLIVILTARYTGMQGRGEISLMYLNITVVLLFNDLVGGGGLVFLSSREHYGHLARKAYGWAVLSAVVVSIMIQLVLGLSFTNTCWLLALALMSNLSSVSSNLLNGKEKIKENNLGNLAQTLLLFLLLLLQLKILNKNTASVYYLALLAGYALNFIISLLYLLPIFKEDPDQSKQEPELLRKMFRCGWPLQWGNAAQLFNYRLSYYFIEFSMQSYNKSELGIFSTANSVAESVWVIMNGISMVQYARISANRNERYAATLSIKLAKISFVISVVLLLIMNSIPDVLLEGIFGKGFSAMKPIIHIISPGVALLAMTGIYAHYFAGLGLMKISSMSAVVGLAGTILLGLTLIPLYGITGAAISTCVSYLLSGLYLIYQFRKKSNTRYTTLLFNYKDTFNLNN